MCKKCMAKLLSIGRHSGGVQRLRCSQRYSLRQFHAFPKCPKVSRKKIILVKEIKKILYYAPGNVCDRILQISVGSVEKMLAYSREAATLISDLYAHLNVLVLITESISALYGQLLL